MIMTHPAPHSPLESNMSIYGYFDAPGQTKPAHDPGMAVPCPICLRGLDDGQPVKAISLMAMDGDRSYFFRAHKECWNLASEEEQAQIEGALIDSISPGTAA